ncbi:MAG TPA: class I SAM-dependent methyltransferase, partial [Blastocatellia bacterium]
MMNPENVEKGTRGSYNSNKKYYEMAGVPEYYASNTKLMKAEEVIFSSLRDEIKDKPILDIGVGAGRTTPYLKAISENYTGTDYSENMLKVCREKVGDVTLVLCDAKNMSIFEDEKFAAVFYCFNALDDADPPDRILMLKEINRVLKKNGIFVFSSHNFDWEAIPTYSFKGFSFSPNPITLISDNINRLRVYASGLLTRLRNKMGRRTWAFILEYENFSRMPLPVYYIGKEAQVRQLLDEGFHQVESIGIDGLPINGEKSVTDP